MPNDPSDTEPVPDPDDLPEVETEQEDWGEGDGWCNDTEDGGGDASKPSDTVTRAGIATSLLLLAPISSLSVAKTGPSSTVTALVAAMSTVVDTGK